MNILMKFNELGPLKIILTPNRNLQSPDLFIHFSKISHTEAIKSLSTLEQRIPLNENRWSSVSPQKNDLTDQFLAAPRSRNPRGSQWPSRHVIRHAKWKLSDRRWIRRRRNREWPSQSHAETMIKIVNIQVRPPVLRPLRGHGALQAHPIHQRILDYGKRWALTNVDSREHSFATLRPFLAHHFSRNHHRSCSDWAISPRELHEFLWCSPLSFLFYSFCFFSWPVVSNDYGE